LTDGADTSGVPRMPSRTDGAVFVEFLIAFLPVLTMFLCMLQLALLFAVRLVVEHAAVNAARTAAVVIGDDAQSYKGSIEPQNEVAPSGGARYEAIRRAAMLSLAPFIVDGTVRNVVIEFPAPNDPAGKAQSAPRYAPMDHGEVQKVRVRVRAEAICKIGLANRIACGGGLLANLGLLRPSHWVQAEAIFPYQGASYTYQ
jgi:hypothetical protein